MTDNPMGNPFGEGFDINALMQQAQAMQEQLAVAQEELAAAQVEGTAGSVGVTVSGTGELAKVTIPTGTFDGADADSLEDLSDLLVAAYRDAKSRADALAQDKLGPLAGGMGGLGGESDPGLPGGGPGIGF